MITRLKTKLRRKYYRSRRFLSDKVYRKNILDTRRDISFTRRQVGSWGSKKLIENENAPYCAVISFTRVPMYAKFHSFVAKALELHGYRPLILTNSGNRLAFDYYTMFGIDDIVKWDEFEQEQITDGVDLNPKVKLPGYKIEDIIAFTYDGVEVGKHALSMTSRERLEGQLDFADDEVQKSINTFIKTAIKDVILTKKLMVSYNIRKMIVRDSGYIPNGPIFETALLNNVDCIVHEFGLQKGTWIFKRHDKNNKGEYHLSLSDKSWQQVKKQEWTTENELKLKELFEERYSSNSMTDTRRLQFGKELKSKEEVIEQIGLDPNKKTAVIFSHLAWDAAFFFGTCIFSDFEKWLFETVKYVSANCADMNWIIKLHPFNSFKLQREKNKFEESEMRLLRSLFPLPDHVRILRADTDINTKSLFPVIDYVLTVNGTVGMEFPCFGIPAIVAGSGRYDHRGFTVDNHSIEEYFQVLDDLHKMPGLTEEQIILAKKHYYILMTQRQTDLEDVLPMELKKFHEAQSELHNNVSFTAATLDEFRSSASVIKLGEWLANSKDYDILT